MSILFTSHYWPGAATTKVNIGATYDALSKSFTVVGGDWTVESIDLACAGVNVNYPPGLTTVAIYESRGDGDTVPVGDPLDSVLVNFSDLPYLNAPQVFADVTHNVLMNGVLIPVGTHCVVVVSVIPPTGFGSFAEYGTGGSARKDTATQEWSGIAGSIVAGVRIYGEVTAVEKPINPTPVNDSGPGINFSNLTFSWEDGGGATKYDVYIGPQAGLVKVSNHQVGLSYTTSLSELQSIFEATPIDQEIYWRIDAFDDAENSAAGDVWNFDPRPAKAEIVAPELGTSGWTIYPIYKWTPGAEMTSQSLVVSLPGLDPLTVGGLTGSQYDSRVVNFEAGMVWGYGVTYNWQINSINQFGTTEGDAWYFDTINFTPPMPTFIYLNEWELGPLPVGNKPAGVLGVDFRWLGFNNVVTLKKLVMASKGAIWVEE